MTPRVSEWEALGTYHLVIGEFGNFEHSTMPTNSDV